MRFCTTAVGKVHKSAPPDPYPALVLIPIPIRPLCLQVKSRIAAGDRDDNRGLAFASDNWQLQQDGGDAALESLDSP